MLQHSFVLCLEPPKSAEDHISMLSAAAIDDSDRALTIAAHHAFLKHSNIIKSVSDEDYLVSFFQHVLKSIHKTKPDNRSNNIFCHKMPCEAEDFLVNNVMMYCLCTYLLYIFKINKNCKYA